MKNVKVLTIDLISGNLSRLMPLVIMAIFFTGAVCCGRKEVSHDHDVARQLFDKSVRMISVYIDSVKNAPDSGSLQRIVNNFNTKITTLNFEFPSDTDLELNEDENDSLIRMHKRFVKAIHIRDSILAHPLDSLKAPIVSDSIKKSPKTVSQNTVSTKER